MTGAIQAKELYDKLLSRGFTLLLKSDGLVVSPSSALTPEDADAIRMRKPELIWLLRVCAEGIAPEADEYGVRLTPRMSGALYVALANARRETFLAMNKRGSVDTEED